MTTENLQKSKKYVVTKLMMSKSNEAPFVSVKEKQLCRCETLQECAEIIIGTDQFWDKCRYGEQNLTLELCDLIIKLKKLQKRSNSLQTDFS